MQNNKYLFVLNLLWLLTTSVLRSEATCDSLLLSLSSAGVCEDGVCIAKELAQVRTSLDADSSFCFRIDQHEFNGPDKIANFTVLDSWISYPLSNCYFSDDPQVYMQGFCHCPLAGTVDCSNCPLLDVANGTNVCIQGGSIGKGCIGSGSSHCVKASFVGGNRYKICSVGNPEIEIQYKFFDTISYRTAVTKLSELLTIKTDQVNLTFYDINLEKFKLNDFVIIDLLNPNALYVVPEKQVNDIYTIDPEKLGWYRFNSTLPPRVSKYIDIVVASCSQDDFRYGIGLIKFNEVLLNHPDWKLENKLPGSLVSDPDAASIQTSGVIYDPPLPFMIQGGYYLDADGQIITFGLDDSGSPPPLGDYYVWQSAILTNKGYRNLDSADYSFKCGYFKYMGYYDDSQFRNSYYIRQCVNIADEGEWGICRSLHTIDLTTGFALEYVNCTNPNFYAIRWPDNFVGTWTTSWNNENILYFVLTGTEQVPQFNTTSDRLIRKSSETSVKVDVEFLNITIKFDVTNIVPDIKRIDNDDDYIFVYAESNTVKGSCLLMISDDIGPTKTIELSLVENKYKVPITIKKFKGDVEISIQCYKNRDRAKFYIEVNKDKIDVNYDSLSPDNIKTFSQTETTFGKVNNAASKVGSTIAFGLSKLFDLTSSSIANFFIGIILSITSFAAFAIFSYILFRFILPYIWMKMANMYRRRSIMGTSSSGIIPLSQIDKKRT